ncbi:hypothetical protein [Lacticaseibacillus paracasei]|uniref:hypothetical protein n=1 Tax=Lacticaseibacillus paracasei TaxID=1597 RepID=UPI001F00B717|nr:hypothetical protein [Lacticaseibacillus paracasei]
MFAHAITTDAWRNSLDHYQEFVIIVALDLKIEVAKILLLNRDLKLSSKGLSRLINPQNPYIVLTTLDGRLDFTFISMSNLKKLKSELMSLEIKSMD